MRSACLWQGESVASRIYFTDVAPKDEHIHRGRVADLFLDTFEVYHPKIWQDQLVLTTFYVNSATPILLLLSQLLYSVVTYLRLTHSKVYSGQAHLC